MATLALLVLNLQDILSLESTLPVLCHWFGANQPNGVNQSNHKDKVDNLHLSKQDKDKDSLVDLEEDLVDSIQEVDLVVNIQVDFLELEDNILVDNIQELEDNIQVDSTLELEVNIQVELVDNTQVLEGNIQEVPLEDNIQVEHLVDNILLLVELQVDNTHLLEVLLEVDILNSLNNPNNLLTYLLLHHLNLSLQLKMLSKMLDTPNVVVAATLLGITKTVKKLNSSKGSLVNIL